MKIEPRNNLILLETYDLPKVEGKIILPNAPKDTQLYKVISGFVENGQVVYLKGNPNCITQGDKKFYITEEENVIAVVKI